MPDNRLFNLVITEYARQDGVYTFCRWTAYPADRIGQLGAGRIIRSHEIVKWMRIGFKIYYGE